MYKSLLSVCLLISFLAFFEETAAQKTGRAAVGDTQDRAWVVGDFNIISVIDERTAPDSAVRLFFSAEEKPATREITVQSATIEGIRNILAHRNTKNTAMRPLRIRVQECNIKEILSGGRVLGEATVVLAFDVIKDSGPQYLTRYKSIARYNRSPGNLSIVEPTLGKLLKSSLKFIDSWIVAEASRNPILAGEVSLTFRSYKEQHADTVYYDPMRPLVWDDFREKRTDSKFAASVFPSFGYDQSTKIVDGTIHIDLVLKVYVIKSASWVGPGTRSNYSLEHEQKHFDLVRIIAERFKNKLLSEKLTPDNFQGIINFEYLEFYREMNRIQREYDGQTSHGMLPLMQEIWNRKIDADLKLLN